MVKSFRFLLQFAWINLGSLVGCATFVIAGAYATGVPRGADNLFRNYFGAMPLMTLFILFMFAFALCTSNLNLALSMGTRRRDYFWAIHGIMLLYAAECWLIQLLMSKLPALGGWTQLDRWNAMLTLGGGTLWTFPVMCLIAMALGCLGGLILSQSKVWGAIVITAAIILLFVGTILMMLMADLNLWSFLRGGAWSGLWGVLPGVLTVVLLAAFAAAEAVIWRTIQKFVVR